MAQAGNLKGLRRDGTGGKDALVNKTFLGLWFLPLVLTGCFLFPREEVSYKSLPYYKPVEEIWKVIEEVMVEYQIAQIDEQKGILETRWDTILGVSRYESTRRKVFLRLNRQEDGSYIVEVKVKVEHNTNIPSSIEPGAMKWGAAGYDREAAALIIWKLNFRLLDPEIIQKSLKKEPLEEP